MSMASASTSPMPPRPRRPTRPIPNAPLDVAHMPTYDNDSALVESPVEEAQPPSTDLTPVRAHYLKKSLIQLQFNDELDGITSSSSNNISTFSYLGTPFSPPPKDAPNLDLPFLRYIFRQFVTTFPFMAAAPKDFYSDKLQPFMASVLSRNLSPTSPFDETAEASETATRLKLLGRLERNLAMFIGSATKLEEPEQVVRLTQQDLDRLETVARKRQKRNLKQRDIFEVNIVSVRSMVDKGRMRSRVHDEFIIRTRRTNHPDHFVARRYGDFKTLADELRKMHPQEDIRPPPAKDRSTVKAPVSPSTPSYPSFSSFEDVPATPPSPGGAATSRLSREKNRLTLRAYLHSLLSSSTIASSPVLRSFLIAGPISLTPLENEDARRREEADHVREEGRKRFAKEIADRIDGLRDAVTSVKGDIMGQDGLTHVFATIKITSSIHDLPQNYQDVLEWARISMASTIFHQFIASDNSSQTFASLKRLHGLMPYFMLKAALKISNPMGMIRSILDLFLAQPFGGRSLLQRMFSGSLAEEVKALDEEIEAVKEKVEDPIMCEKIRRFVYGAKEIQDLYKSDAQAENLPLLTVVLRSADEPVLTRAQLHRVARAHRAHSVYMKKKATLDDSDDDDGPQDDDAWLYEDLKVLANLYTRLRDREQLIELIFEGFTAELLKDIITIFYTPLAAVYRAASIADSLGDLQSFINDLIKTVEGIEEASEKDPQRTVQAFIDLVQRHEQSFYDFVHKVHSKGEGLFDSLMRWIDLFITIIREGIGSPLTLEFLLPHTGEERRQILEEVDKVALYHYKLKVIYEDKVRRRFGRAQGKGGEEEEREVEQMVNNVVGELNFGELVSGGVQDLAAEDSDISSDSDEHDEDDEDESREEDDSDDKETSTEEESSEAEESSDDGEFNRTPIRQRTPMQAPREQMARLRTLTQPRIESPLKQVKPTLRKSRSAVFSDMKNAMSRKKEEAPPLPNSRASTITAAVDKPLPPNPAKQSFDSVRSAPIPSRSLHRSSATPVRQSIESVQSAPPMVEAKDPATPSKKARRKKAGEKINPPDLVHIPKLLPLFKEMMRPHLRPRARTTPPS